MFTYTLLQNMIISKMKTEDWNSMKRATTGSTIGTTFAQFGSSSVVGRLLLSVVFLFVLASVSFSSEPVPAKKQEKPIALIGGTIHTVTNGTIENGTIVFDNGKITQVGKNVVIPAGAEKIDVTGKHVYPGLINAASTAGLQEIESIRATVDTRETGSINPNVRTEIAVNPESEIIPTIRANGITLSHLIPSGGLIAGRTSVIMMDGWTNEEMTLYAPAGMYVNWPSMSVSRSPYVRLSEEEQTKNILKNLSDLRSAFDDARAYLQAKKSDPSNHPTDVRWEAMAGVFAKEIPLIVKADDIRQIRSAVLFAKEHDIRLIIHGGRDAWTVTSLLKENNVPVIVGPIFDLPAKRWDGYDSPFTPPKKLYDAGIPFAISGEGLETMGERSLGFQAATAAAYGLPREEALRSVTISAARILGIEQSAGSLELGKDATIIVTTGDPLEILTNVEMEYIQGKKTDLRSRHTQLWKKYEEKYRQLGIIR